jgi:hypothetical protein
MAVSVINLGETHPDRVRFTYNILQFARMTISVINLEETHPDIVD